jgi:perosamine synthetase
VFADVGRNSINMTPETLESAITPRSAAVVITHQFGLPCDIDRMLDICRRHGLLAIEDAAASFGAMVHGGYVGGFGDVGILSFNVSKALSVCTGGALVTNDEEMAAGIGLLLKRHSNPGLRSSWRPFVTALRWKVATEPGVYPALRLLHAIRGDDYQILSPGPAQSRNEPSVCPPYTAALVSARAENLSWNLERRRRLGDIYGRELCDVPGISLPQVPPDVQPAWIQYPIFVPDKRELCAALLRKSIDLSWTFRYCTADSYGAGTCPNSTRAAHEQVGLPVHPSLPDTAAYRVCSMIREYAASRYSSHAAVHTGHQVAGG